VKLQVLMADVVETLQSGKQLLCGLYPDRVMVVGVAPDSPEIDESHPLLLQAAFLITLTELAVGPHLVGIQFVHGDGSAMHPFRPPINVASIPGSSTNIVMTRVDLPVKGYGVHNITFTVDDQEPVIVGFEIRLLPHGIAQIS